MDPSYGGWTKWRALQEIFVVEEVVFVIALIRVIVWGFFLRYIRLQLAEERVALMIMGKSSGVRE